MVYVSRPLLIALVVAAFAIGAAIAGAAFTARVPDTEAPIALVDRYAGELHTGHKIAVRYSVALSEKDTKAANEAYNESNTWAEIMRTRLRKDFGPAIEERWALGVRYRTVGESARGDHESRVWKLADLMDDMRSGRLTKVKP